MAFSQARFLVSATSPQGYPKHKRTEVALAGRSNVGKSSLINALTVRGLAHVGKRPGRTQTINFFALNEALCLVDLPGYGYAEVPERVRAAWGPMIERYLTSREQLGAIILLLDGRHGPTADDLEMLAWLKRSERDFRIVATKWDKVKKNQRLKRKKEMEEATACEVIPFSAVTSEGKAALIAYLVSLA